jgi:hypothetical protein
MNKLNKKLMIAQCGINCRVCRAHIRDKNKCPGCRAEDEDKMKSCINCKIKNCKVFHNGKTKFCFECKNFPCANLKHLDKRYQTKYNMSVVENLENIKKFGINLFVENEKIRWTCSKCGGTICVHNGFCSACGKK